MSKYAQTIVVTILLLALASQKVLAEENILFKGFYQPDGKTLAGYMVNGGSVVGEQTTKVRRCHSTRKLTWDVVKNLSLSNYYLNPPSKDSCGRVEE
jgi:hypothetical protein